MKFSDKIKDIFKFFMGNSMKKFTSFYISELERETRDELLKSKYIKEVDKIKMTHEHGTSWNVSFRITFANDSKK